MLLHSQSLVSLSLGMQQLACNSRECSKHSSMKRFRWLSWQHRISYLMQCTLSTPLSLFSTSPYLVSRKWNSHANYCIRSDSSRAVAITTISNVWLHFKFVAMALKSCFITDTPLPLPLRRAIVPSVKNPHEARGKKRPDRADIPWGLIQ